MRYNTLITKVADIIDDGGTGIQVIYTAFPKAITQHPACVITPVGHKNEYRTIGGSNTRKYTLHIAILANIEGIEETGQEEVRDLVDDVIDILEAQSNLTLEGEVDYSTPTQAEFSFERETANIYKAVITLEVVALHNRRT